MIQSARFAMPRENKTAPGTPLLATPIDSGIRGVWVAVIFLATLSFFSTSVQAREPERWAILIGIDGYFDLKPLESSSKDAIEFGDVLKDRCGFKNISVVVDKPKQGDDRAMLNLRFKTLRARLRSFVRAAEQSGVQTLVVYYSGHGCAVLNPNQQQPTDLLLPAIDASESNGDLINAISKNEIQKLLSSASIPEKLLILDCCHASQPDQIPMNGKAVRIGVGVAADTTKKTPAESGSLIAPSDSGSESNHPMAENSNFIVLAGSGFQQIAGEQVFTKHIVDGLSVIGDAAKDSDQSQWIEIDELFGYVRNSMSAAGDQLPSLALISGRRDGIRMAPSVFQPDPQREMSVYVQTEEGNVLSNANVKLIFVDRDRSVPETLASAETNVNGRAKLRYHFGTTRERNGQFQISVAPSGRQYKPKSTQLSKFASAPPNSFFKISLKKNVTSVLDRREPEPSKRPSRAVPELAYEPSHQEVMHSISEFISRNNEIPDFCSFEKHFADYYQLMKQLKRNDKLKAHGVTVCFPSAAFWRDNDQFRAQVIAVLTAKGVLDPNAKRRAPNLREPTYNEVKKAAFGFVQQINADVCGLVDVVDGYKTLIDTLDRSEKFQILPGLTVCFPSKKSWDAKPDFRRKFVQVLRASFVLAN